MESPRLLDLLRTAIRIRHYSYRTEQTHVQWAVRYIRFHKLRHPKEMGTVEVAAFLSHLAEELTVSASTQNQALNALVFLYKHVLNQELGNFEGVVRSKRPKRLPVVFTRDEALAVLQRLDGRNRLMANLLYGAGLRLMECHRLRVKDIDFGYKPDYRQRWKGAQGPDNNAPGGSRATDPRTGKLYHHHQHECILQKAVKLAIRNAGIVKLSGCHTFRQSFATHLLTSGYDIRTVQ